MASHPRLIRQRHSHDCAIASLAMVMGVSLDEARAAFERVYPGATAKGQAVTEGITHWETDNVLAEEGFAICRIWCGAKGNRYEPWPPPPFADVHLVQVVLVNGGHVVVLLRDGTVLDPAQDAPTTLADPRFVAINYVAGVVRIAKPELTRTRAVA